MSAPVLEEMAAVTALWSQLRLPDRARYLERAAQAVIDEFDDLCLAIASESQRPRPEIATLELLSALDALRWLGEHAPRTLGARRFALPRALHPLTRASAGHAPVGVVGVRGGGGSPFAGPIASVGAALLAGNGVVLQGAPDAIGAAERLAGVLARAGLPEGLLRVEGTTPLECARLLDLGAGPRGPDAMIVLGDATLAHAVEGALWAACAGAGRLAGSLKRVYVVRERHADFLDALCAAAEDLTLGDPLLPGTQLGPLPGADTVTTLEAAIEEAVALGATLHCGGRAAPALAGSGVLFAPAVLSDVPAGARLARERVAGPVLAVTAVPDSVVAAALGNSAEPSVGASIWSSDRRAAVRIARELQARVVWGNDHFPGEPTRQIAAEALARCSRAQLIAWDAPSRRAPWRYPYDASTARAAATLAALHSSREGDREQALRGGAPAIVRIAARTLRG